MPSQAQKSDSSASSTKSMIAPDQLIALPSLSCALSSLPQAKSLANLSIHPSMSNQRAQESQAKLQKALSKSSANQSPPPLYSHTQQAYSSDCPPLMMRKSTKSKIQV